MYSFVSITKQFKAHNVIGTWIKTEQNISDCVYFILIHFFNFYSSVILLEFRSYFGA